MVHTFVASIAKHRARFGKLRVDGSVATLALEHLVPGELWVPGTTGVDTIAFHRESMEGATIVPGVIANQLDICIEIHATKLVVCTRDRLPADTFSGLKVSLVPTGFLETFLTPEQRKVVTFEDRGVVFRTGEVIEGSLGQLPRGTYEWTLALAPDEPMQLDGFELARLEVLQGQSMIPGTARRVERELVLRFHASGDQPLGFRFAARPATPLVITSMRLRPVADQ